MKKKSPYETPQFAIDFMRLFVTSVHPAVYTLTLQLTRSVDLFYENQSWLEAKYLVLLRGEERLFTYGDKCGLDFAWEGKEIPQILQAAFECKDVDMVLLRQHEMPRAAFDEITAVRETERCRFVCAKLYDSLKT